MVDDIKLKELVFLLSESRSWETGASGFSHLGVTSAGLVSSLDKITDEGIQGKFISKWSHTERKSRCARV